MFATFVRERCRGGGEMKKPQDLRPIHPCRAIARQLMANLMVMKSRALQAVLIAVLALIFATALVVICDNVALSQVKLNPPEFTSSDFESVIGTIEAHHTRPLQGLPLKLEETKNLDLSSIVDTHHTHSLQGLPLKGAETNRLDFNSAIHNLGAHHTHSLQDLALKGEETNISDVIDILGAHNKSQQGLALTLEGAETNSSVFDSVSNTLVEHRTHSSQGLQLKAADYETNSSNFESVMDALVQQHTHNLQGLPSKDADSKPHTNGFVRQQSISRLLPDTKLHPHTTHDSTRAALAGIQGNKHKIRNSKPVEERVQWTQFPYLGDESEKLLRRIAEIQNAKNSCLGVTTTNATIVGLPKAEKGRPIRVRTGVAHKFSVLSMGKDGKQRCGGGDYYETDLNGDRWKSRPPILDNQDGSYTVQLQVDARFAGRYHLKIILLYSKFDGLRYHPARETLDKQICDLVIEFAAPEDEMVQSQLRSATGSFYAPLEVCKAEDFQRKYWSGRWIRGKFNKSCEIDRLGRFRCLDPNLECEKPWCEGAVGALESNGWVYSAHCSFKLFKQPEAWKCLNKKWLFLWGDSNHIDTIRNLLNFVLGFNHSVTFLDRRMDTTFANPNNSKQSVRITSMFNGHSNVSMNYEGLYSLYNPAYQDQLKSFFQGNVGPDIMIMNSGLHDGMYWKSTEAFYTRGVQHAIKFWQSVWSNMTAARPDIIYRTTVATSAHARSMPMDTQKMELYNHLFLDAWTKLNLSGFKIVDGFDYTFPWHYTTEHSDGVHYGRPPSKSKWAGGRIGHQYFVDVMLVHILLNAVCNS